MAASFKSLLWSALITSSHAVRLFAAQADGNVTTLSLDENGGTYSLTESSRTIECADNPSVLTLDYDARVLYCYDRGCVARTSPPREACSIGSFNSFSISDTDGSLTRISRIEAPYAGVWGEILTTPGGNRTYISANYKPAAVAVFLLGEDGTLPGTGALEVISPTIEAPGPVASRQDQSYGHHVIIDPNNLFVLIADLGGDLFRVYAYMLDEVVPLTELEPLRTAAGVGPRHGFFRVNDAGETFFFFVGELSQKIYSYKVTYGESGLSWEAVFEYTALGPDSSFAATTAPASEFAMTPDKKFAIVSNREVSYKGSASFQSGPSDTLSTWAFNDDGTLNFVQNVPSGGYWPRHFSINKAGDMIAVGHQTNSTVVIWKRDVVSGKIVTEEEGGKLGELFVGEDGQVMMTIWDE